MNTPPDDRDFPLLLFMIEERWKEGQYVLAEEVAGAIEMTGDHPLPSWLRDLACAHLRGKVKRPRGRPPAKNEWQDRFVALARRDYDRVLQYLQRRAKRPRSILKTRRPSRCRPDGPLHEKTLELVYRHYQKVGEFRSIDLRRFRDLISARK